MDLIHVKRRGQGKTSIYTIKALTDQKRDELLGIEKNGADTQKFQNETTRSTGSEPQELTDETEKNTQTKKTQVKKIVRIFE